MGGSKLTDSSCGKDLNWRRRGGVETAEGRKVRKPMRK